MKYKTKAWLCRISSALIGAGTPFAVIVASPNMYFYKPAASVSAIALIAIILSATAFKDSIMKFIKTPSALKIWAALLVLSILAQHFFTQLVVLSAWSLGAQCACLPLNHLDAKFTEAAKCQNELKLKKELESK